MSYKYEKRYIKYDLTPLFRQNLIKVKKRSKSGTKFVPFKLNLVHRRSLEKISSSHNSGIFLLKLRKKFKKIK
jgi:hypothetical protein